MRPCLSSFPQTLSTPSGESNYGPLAIVSVTVLDNDPVFSPPGRTTEMVGVTRYVPEPVLVAVPKNCTGVGAGVRAAGNPTDAVTVFVKESSEQVPLTLQVAVVLVMVDASIGNVPAVPVSVVEVMESFHPVRAPVRSLTVKANGYVIVVPGVPVKLYVVLATSLNEPAVIVPFTTGESAKAGVTTIPAKKNNPMTNVVSNIAL